MSKDVLTYLRAKQRKAVPYYRMKLMVIGLQVRMSSCEFYTLLILGSLPPLKCNKFSGKLPVRNRLCKFYTLLVSRSLTPPKCNKFSGRLPVRNSLRSGLSCCREFAKFSLDLFRVAVKHRYLPPYEINRSHRTFLLLALLLTNGLLLDPSLFAKKLRRLGGGSR